MLANLDARELNFRMKDFFACISKCIPAPPTKQQSLTFLALLHLGKLVAFWVFCSHSKLKPMSTSIYSLMVNYTI